ADAIHSPLLRKRRGVGRSGLQASDVIALQPRQCQRTDRGPLGAEKLAVRRARVVGVETAVVADDENVVAGHGEIELERRHADCQRRGESRERVFRRQTACTAVALQVECDGHRTQEEADDNHSCGDSRHGHAPSSRHSVERPTLTTTARRYCDAVTPYEWRWLLARIEANGIFSRNGKFNQATAKPLNYSSTSSCA